MRQTHRADRAYVGSFIGARKGSQGREERGKRVREQSTHGKIEKERETDAEIEEEEKKK